MSKEFINKLNKIIHNDNLNRGKMEKLIALRELWHNTLMEASNYNSSLKFMGYDTLERYFGAIIFTEKEEFNKFNDFDKDKLKFLIDYKFLCYYHNEEVDIKEEKKNNKKLLS